MPLTNEEFNRLTKEATAILSDEPKRVNSIGSVAPPPPPPPPPAPVPQKAP